jgi:murein DD-endopeptidase MepM/ murein hydrolase activator NlpD
VAARSLPMFGRRRRRPVVAILGVLVVLGPVPVLLSASPIGPWSLADSPIADVAATEAVRPAPERASAPVAHEVGEQLPTVATAVFATIDAVSLHLPAEEVVLVGFHEASSRDASAFDPVGALEDHQNTTKFDPPPDVSSGPPYVVLSSRGRPFPATSAIDVLLDEAVPVRSPVSGIVTEVRSYHLYGKYADQRIEIAPLDAPEQRIVMIHLDGVRVSIGDEVRVGETVVAAGARLFPFGSHIDRYTEPHRYPHVHYEIKRAPPAAKDAAGDAADPAG